MDEQIENEEEQKVSQKKYHELEEMTDLQRQTISLQKEELQLKDQLIEKLQYELVLLSEKVQQIEDQIEELSGSPTPSASVHFSRPPKNMLKKHRRKHG